jgi:predicted Rdx family selenoprotein
MATSLAAAIKKGLGLEPTLKRGPIGVFDVYADEWVIYSNRKEGGRLPKNAEVIQRIRDIQGRASPGKATRAEVEKSQEAPACGPGCG